MYSFLLTTSKPREASLILSYLLLIIFKWETEFFSNLLQGKVRAMKGCTIHISTLANDLGNPGASFILHVSNSVGGIPGGITVTKLQLSFKL